MRGTVCCQAGGESTRNRPDTLTTYGEADQELGLDRPAMGLALAAVSVWGLESAPDRLERDRMRVGCP